jgi:hypothetical protein
MTKRKISIKVEDLPLRSTQLSQEELGKIFGGSNLGESCINDCQCTGWPNNVCGGSEGGTVCVTLESELKKGVV